MAKKKKFDEAMQDYGAEQENFPFGTYDDDVFAALDSAQVSTDTLPIMSIMADITQPRKNIVPREIRGTWTGHPKAWPNLIQRWEEAVFDSGVDIPILEVLRGKENPFDYLVDNPLVIKFIELLDFAGQIHDVGLQQRIGVKPKGQEYTIIYGERRWSAFHLLNYYMGDDYASIPARVAHVSEWELAKIQAAENFHQDELNAISKARQFAKLLIIANAEKGNYDSWSALVNDGGCDRPWYAQVANGDLHPIPYGMGPQFEQTLGISPGQMRRYRALLKLTDDYEVNNILWDLGDDNDWAEGFMRDIKDNLEVETIQEVLRSVPIGTLLENAKHIEEMLREAIAAAKAAKPKRQAPAPEPEEIDEETNWPSQEWVGKWAYAGKEKVWVREATLPETVIVTLSNGEDIAMHLSTLTFDPPSEETAGSDWSATIGGGTVKAGDTVLVNTSTGSKPAVVVGPSNLKSQIDVQFEDGHIQPYYKSTLTLASEDTDLEGGKIDNSLLNKRVQLDDGTTGIVSHVDGHNIRIIRDDNGRTLYTMDGYIVAILDEEPDAESTYNIGDIVWVYRGDGRKDKGEIRYFKDGLYGVFKFVSGSTHYYNEDQLEIWNGEDTSLPSSTGGDLEGGYQGSDNTNSDTPSTAAQWVGKPALITIDENLIPVVVISTVNAEEVMTADGAGNRWQVSIDELQPAPAQPGQTLGEYYDTPPTSNPSSNGTGSSGTKATKQPAIPYGNTARVVISFLSQLSAELKNPEVKTTLEAFNNLTMAQADEYAADGELNDYLEHVDIHMQEATDYMMRIIDSAFDAVRESVAQSTEN